MIVPRSSAPSLRDSVVPFSVEARSLTIKFGDFTAVDRVSFAVSPGEIFGFLGANGAGKTTTIRTLCGLLLPTQGEVFVAGLNVRERSQEVKARVGYMSQRFTLYQDMTVEENLTFAGNLRKLEPSFVRERIRELFDFIGFRHPLDTRVAALLHDPDVLFLDEPTSGVTPRARVRFWELIRGVASRGKTVFVTTHYMDEAEQCERIALMRTGAVIALDSPEGLKGKAFPGPLFEVEPRMRDDPEVSALAELPCVLSWRPYGLRYHVAVTDEVAWERAAGPGEAGGRWKVRRISPSLEDVFLELVEGKP